MLYKVAMKMRRFAFERRRGDRRHLYGTNGRVAVVTGLADDTDAVMEEPRAVKSWGYPAEFEVALDMLDTPVWVFDVEKRAMWWSNQAGVELWGAATREELLGRSFSDMSDSTVSRLNDYLRKFALGERIVEQWTYHPRNVAVTANVTCTGVRIESTGRLAMKCEAVPVDVSNKIERSSLRAVEYLRHLALAVEQVDMDGRILEQNPAAVSLFGSADVKPLLSERFVDAAICATLIADLSVETDETYCEVEIEALLKEHGKEIKWFAIKARRTVDPETSRPCLLCNMLDVDHHIKSQMAMRALKDEAEEGTRLKSEFFAVLTHEIRTPLNGIIGFSDLLYETSLDDNQRGFLGTLRSSAGALMSIINDILDFSKVEAGQMKVELTYFDLEAVMDSALAIVGPKAEGKRLNLYRRTTSRALTDVDYADVDDYDEDNRNSDQDDERGRAYLRTKQLVGDPNRIRQILLNILSNAVKFTDVGSVCLETTVLDPPVESGDEPHRGGSPYQHYHSLMMTTTATAAARKNIYRHHNDEDGEDEKVVAMQQALRRKLSSAPPEVVEEDPADVVKTIRIRFAMRDTGPGIQEGDLGKLFKQFSQTSSSVARKYGGTGLGLVISKNLVETMGGRIGVKSRFGRGSTFWFEIPFEVRDQPPQSPTSSNLPSPMASPMHTYREVSSSSASSSSIAESEGAPPASPETVVVGSPQDESSPLTARPLRILVVEDNPVNQRLVQSVLAKLGHEISKAWNGVEAVEEVKRRRDGDQFDLLFMDIQMPVMDGIAATRAIRELGYDDVTIVGLTADFFAGDLTRYLDAGMNSCLGKPYRIKDLRACVFDVRTQVAAKEAAAREAATSRTQSPS